MFARDLMTSSSETGDYFAELGEPFNQGPTSGKNDSCAVLNNTYYTELHSRNNDHYTNIVSDDFSEGGYCYGNVMKGNERFVRPLNSEDVANLKHTMQDYPVFDYTAPRPSAKSLSLVTPLSPNKCNNYYGFNAAVPGLFNGLHDKESNFGYGLDALIHGVQLGFGPQPSFRVAAPVFSHDTRGKLQDIYYDLDGLENATITAETYSSKNNTSSARGGIRKRSDDVSGDTIKGRTNLVPFCFPERRLSSGETSSREQYTDKREAFAREARGYMQEMGFIFSQLFGESENGVNYTGKNINTNSTTKMDAAHLEAVLTGESTSHIKSPMSLSSPSLSRRKKSNSTPLKNKPIAPANDTYPSTLSRRQEKNTPLTGEKKKSVDMEYPVFDDNALRESLMWPNFAMKPGRDANSTRKRSETNYDFSGVPEVRKKGRELLRSQQEQQQKQNQLQQQKEKHEEEEEEEEDHQHFEGILGSMEYPSVETLRENAMFLPSNALPLFPQLAFNVTGRELSKISRSLTMAPEAERDSYIRLEKDLREQEQRIVEARKEANDKAARRVSRMVVIDSRYAKKPEFNETSDINQIKKLEEQQKVNEERRARVQAFLEKRHAKVAMQKEVKQRTSEDVKIDDIPRRSQNTDVYNSSSGVRASTASSVRRLPHGRRKSSSKPFYVTAPYLVEQPLEEPANNEVQTKQQQEKEQQQQQKRENANSKYRVASLLIVQRRRVEQKDPKVKITLQGEKTIEIRQSHEMPRFFEVDEYMESHDDKSLYSMTLLRLRRRFLSGFNVALFLAGSESALLLSWRAVHEVMEGVFRDLGEEGELFLSVALVREGLTQDLLSESGRMVRTTYNFSALLDVTLDNVAYTKLQDLQHLSKLLAHAWELAGLRQTHHSGFIAISIILKQIKGDDIILSSMLVTSGNSSVDYLNGVLRKDDREPNRLFSAALGGPCFTVAVLALDEDDEGVVQLMNTQRKLSSINNRPGTVGSAKQYIERAEKELSSYKSDDKSKTMKCNFFREQITALKVALLDPKKYIPREDVNSLHKRHAMRNKDNLGRYKGHSSEDPNTAVLGKKETVPGTLQGHEQQQEEQRKQQQEEQRKEQQQEQRKEEEEEEEQRKQQKHPSKVGSVNSIATQDTSVKAKKPNNQQASRPLQDSTHDKLKLPPPSEKFHTAKKSPEKASHTEFLPKTGTGTKDVCVLPNLTNVSPSANKSIVSNKSVSKKIQPLTVTSQVGLDTPSLEPVKRRQGRRQYASSTSPGIEKNLTVLQNPSHTAISNKKIPCDITRIPVPLKLPPCKELSPAMSRNSSMSYQSSNIKKNSQGLITKNAPSNNIWQDSHSSLPRSHSLSVSAPVGATASTRYINRTGVPPQKPIFRNLEALSQTINGVVVPPRDSEMSSNENNSPEKCRSTEQFMHIDGMSEESPSTPIPEQEEYIEEECEEGGNVNDNNNNNYTDSKEENEHSSNGKRTPSTENTPSVSSKVRTLVMVDSGCNETANVTHDETMVIVMTDDDFEEYEVDEVVERPDDSEFVQSNVLDELRDKFLLGCNAAILAADSRSSAISTLVLKSVVHEVLDGITENSHSPHPQYRGSLSVSIVQLKGETVLDLLKENSTAQKLVIAISPIFGPCVHNVSRLRVDSAVLFDSMLTSALTRAAENGREYGVVFVSMVLKQKQKGEKDVLVSSLITCLVGENVGLYAAVLDRSPLVPRALFHYALGGPCYTVALLGFSGEETRANQMLAVQKRLGEVINRPTHPGSINKFISGIHSDLAPSLRSKLENPDEYESTKKILQRLEEMVRDAETLLNDFEKSEPKAYLNDTEPTKTKENRTGRKPPLVTLTNSNDGNKVRSLVCFEERLLGNGSIAVQGNSVLTRVGEFVCRYDVDEIVVRESGSNSMTSQIVDDLVLKFLSGHNAALLSADSRSSAVTPLIIRKIAYLILYNLTMGSQSAPVKAELLASIALVKDDVTVDLLAEDEDNTFHRFEVETSPLFGKRLRGVSYHIVNTAERFDHLLAFAVDRAGPALRSEDPGIMVISLILTQYFEKPERDVLVSSFMATTVFDNVSHYEGILQNDHNEPTSLFKVALGGPCYTVAMLGLCDEDEDAGKLLAVQMELAHIRNPPSRVLSVMHHIQDLKKGIAMLRNHAESAEDEQQQQYIREKIAQAEGFLSEAVEVLEVPVIEEGFVPLGSQM